MNHADLPGVRPVHRAMRRAVMAASAAMLVLATAGCGALHPPAEPLPPRAMGAWLDLLSAADAEVRPGMTLSLPRAPYRARYADRDGIYYAASQRLLVRTGLGVVQETEGGLYVRHDQPHHAAVWLAPVAGQPARPFEPMRWEVRVHQP